MPDLLRHLAGGASSFWNRQFAADRSGAQVAFDVVCGIVLPAVCVYFDPFVIRTSPGGPLQSGHGVAAFGFIGMGMLSELLSNLVDEGRA